MHQQHHTPTKTSITSTIINDVDEILGKPNYYTIVMGVFIAQIGKRTNPIETATGTLELGLRKGKWRHLGRMGNIKKVQNHE